MDIGILYSIMIENCAESGKEVDELINIFSSFISAKISDFRNSRPYIMSVTLSVIVQRKIAYQKGSGAYNSHIAF